MWTNLLPSKNSQLFMLIPRIYCVRNHTLIQKNHATCYSTIFKYNACKCKVTNPKIFNWNQNFDAVFNAGNPIVLHAGFIVQHQMPAALIKLEA